MSEDSIETAEEKSSDRRVLYAFGVGGFVFVNILLAIWLMRSRSKVGGRDEGVFVSSEIATAIAKCSTATGALIPSSGPLPADIKTAKAGYMATGRELMPNDPRCIPAKLPWLQHWSFTWTVDEPNVHGHLHAWIDRNADGQEEDSLDTEVVCATGGAADSGATSTVTCKVPGTGT